jgi:fibronectin-binding autotransporter adhesin
MSKLQGCARRLSIFIIAAFALFAGQRPASASSFFWVGDDNNVWSQITGPGGTNWSSSGDFNNGTAGVPGSSDDVFFVLSGAGNLPNTELGTNFSIKSLTFTPDATNPVNINDTPGTHSLTLGSGGMTDNGPSTYTMNAAVSLGAVQTWANNAATPLTFNGVISGAAANSLTLGGNGTFVFTAANSYSGSTSVFTGGLTLNGNGTILNTSAISLNAGTSLILDNAAGTNVNQRIAATTGVNTNGGIFSLIGDGVATSQTIGTLAVGSGASVVKASGSGAVLTLGKSGAGAIASLSRSSGGTVNFVALSGANINLPNVATPNGIIGGYAVTGSATGTGLNWATLDGSNNVIPYTNYTQLTADSTGAITSGMTGTAQQANNIQYNATGNNSALITANTTINTLYVTGGSTPIASTNIAGQPAPLPQNGNTINFFNGITFGNGQGSQSNSQNPASSVILTIGAGGIISSGATGVGHFNNKANVTNMGFVGYLFGEYSTSPGTTTDIGQVTVSPGVPDLVAYTDSNLRLASIIVDTPVTITGTTTANLTGGTNIVTLTGTATTAQLAVGESVRNLTGLVNSVQKITGITDATHFTIATNASTTSTGGTAVFGTSIGLTKSGPGLLDLSNGNTQTNKPTNLFTGKVTINEGVLLINAAGELGGAPSAADDVTFNGGELRTFAGLSTTANQGWTVGTRGGIFDYCGGSNSTINNKITGVGGFTYYSRGIQGGNGMTINLGNAGGAAPNGSGGPNDYQGPTNFLLNVSDGSNGSGVNNIGVLAWTQDNQVPSTSAVTMNLVAQDDTFTVIPNSVNSAPVSVNINNHSDHFGSLAGNLGIRNFNSASTLTIGANNLSTEWDGSLYGTNFSTAGAGKLVKVGTGTQIFGGTLNNYTGTTSINGGALLIGTGTGTASSAALTGSAVTVGNGTTLSGTLGGNGTINGAVTVTATGHLAPAMSATTSNTLTINNNLTLNGGATLDYNFGSAGTPGSGDLVNVTGTGNLTLSNGIDLLNISQLSGFNIGTYPLITVTGSGTFTDNAIFAINGKTNFNYLVLQPGASIDPTANGGVAGTVPAGQLWLEVLQGNPNLTWLGSVDGNWDVNQTTNWGGDNTKFTNGANVTFDDFVTGPTNITVATGGVTAASIIFNNASHDYTIGGDAINVTAGAGVTKSQGGNVTINSNLTTPATTINGGAFTIGSTSIYTSTVKLDLNGGTLAVNGTLATANLNVKTGTVLTVASSGALGSATALSVAGTGTATFSNASQTLGGLNGNGSVTLNSTALTLNGNSTFGGTIGGSGALTVAGGTVAFSGANTYLGGTTVAGGTLLANNTTGSATGSGAVLVQSAATLGGTGTISGAVTLNSGGILSPATAGTIGALATGPATINDGGVLNYDLGAPGAGDTTNVNGALSIAGAQMINIGLTTAFGKAQGSYPLFTASGGVSNTATYTVNATGPAANYVYGVTTQGNQVLLNVSFVNRTWTGATDNNWDLTTANWSPDLYKDGYLATFDDTGANTTINIPTTVAPAGVVFNNAVKPYTIGGLDISGTGSVALNGSGTVTFTTPNTYTGGTIINNGMLSISNGNQIGTAPAAAQSDFIVINGGTLQLNISLASPQQAMNGNRGITVGSAGGTLNIPNVSTGSYNANTAVLTYYPGIISGPGSLTVTGGSATNTSANPYILDLDAHSTYAGMTTVNNAILEYFAGAGSASPANVLPVTTVLNLINNGWFNMNDGNPTQTIAGLMSDATGRLGTTNATAANVSALTINTAFGSTYTFAGVMGNLTILNKTGTVAQPLTVTGAGTEIFTGNNTYTGNTTISGGFLQLGAASTLSHTLISIGSENGLTFSPGIGSFIIGGLGGLANNALVDTSGAAVNLQTGNDNAVHNYGGSLSGAGSLTKIGTGTQNLDNVNFNTGVTTVNAGTLQLNFGNTATGTLAGSPSIVVNSGGTLALNAQDAIGSTPGVSALVINSGGTVSNITVPGFHVSIANPVSMTGGTLTSTSPGDAAGAYSLINTGFNATSDATGNPSVISGSPISLQSGNAAFNVTRGAAAPPSDLNVTANLIPSGASTSGIVKTGNGVMTLSSANTYTGPTTISGGTLRLATPPSAVVAHYSFDNVTNGGTTVVNDGSAGSALNGTINTISTGGGNGVLIGAGKFGNGAKFFNDPSAGTLGYVNIQLPGDTTPIDLSSNSNWSVSLWVQTGAGSTSGSTFFSKTTDGTTWNAGNDTFYLTSGNGTNFGDAAGAVRNGGNWISGSTAVDDGNWHMVTYTDNLGAKSIYVDGVLETLTTNAFTATDVGKVLRLGVSTDPQDKAVNLDQGSLDEVYFLNQALTPAQIQALFTSNTFSVPVLTILPTATPVNITAAGATLDVNGVTQTIGSLAGVSGSAVALGGGSLTIGADNTSTTFAGNITDSGSASAATGGSITKLGSGALALNGNNAYTGPTNVNSGVLALGKSFTSGSAVSISAGAALVMSQNGAHVLSTPSISITGGQLDLKDNDLLVPYSGASPISTIRSYLVTGYSGGAWNGVGIDSTLASGAKALGYGEAADLGIAAIDGVSITGNAVVVKYTYYGDSSLDGKVDLGNDFNLFLQGFLNHGSGWELGDYNYDGVINTADFQLFVDGFKTQGGSLGALENVIATSAELSVSQRASLLSIVPEPSTGAMLLIIAAAAAQRRRKRPC